MSNYEVVDLNNNNAREWAENPMGPSSSAAVLGLHTLNAVKEVDGENTE